MTPEMIKLKAKSTDLSNDRIMRLGEERLQMRIKITDMSVQKYWKEMVIPGGLAEHKYIMHAAWKALTCMHMVVDKKSDGSLD